MLEQMPDGSRHCGYLQFAVGHGLNSQLLVGLRVTYEPSEHLNTSLVQRNGGETDWLGWN